MYLIEYNRILNKNLINLKFILMSIDKYLDQKINLVI